MPGWAGRSRTTRDCRRGQRLAARVAAFEAEHGQPPTPAVGRGRAQEARRQHRAVAGYDLVFSPVKSISLLWALGDAGSRRGRGRPP